MATYRFVTLLDNISADADGDWLALPEMGLAMQNRYGAIVTVGTFGNGTMTVQGSHLTSSYAMTLRTPSDTQLAMTVADYMPVHLLLPNIRARFTGSSGASGISCYLVY